MALECQEIVESSCTTRKTRYNKFINLKSSPKIPARKGDSELESTRVGDQGSNGRRSITDLPNVLVSEILHCLDPEDLAVVSCVSTLLNGLATDLHSRWKDFYCKLWGTPFGPAVSPTGTWKELFAERAMRSKSFMGRYKIDVLRGHTEAVRAVFLLQSAKLIFTGGYDSVLRMWDMEEGLEISSSRRFGDTVRAITADTELLVAGGNRVFVQCWRAIEGLPHLFDIAGINSNHDSEFRLWGHEGPVTCLALDSVRIFSGSWDMSIRVWDRVQLKCLMILRHGDWVWGLVPRGSSVVSTAGGNAYFWDIEQGGLMGIIRDAHAGYAFALARSHVGDLLFTGGEDGSIRMFKVANCSGDGDFKFKTVATWTPHTSSVLSLAFEFPWLVSSSDDGRIALINIWKLLGSSRRSSSKHRSVAKQLTPGDVESPQRMLDGSGSSLFSVAIGADRIICGGDEGLVRVWDFSQALEIEKRARALRAIKLENRMRRRKVQIEMNVKDGRTDQGSPTAMRNQNRNGIWHSKRGERKA